MLNTLGYFLKVEKASPAVNNATGGLSIMY